MSSKPWPGSHDHDQICKRGKINNGLLHSYKTTLTRLKHHLFLHLPIHNPSNQND